MTALVLGNPDIPVSLRRCIDALLAKIGELNPSQDYCAAYILPVLLSQLGYDETWISEQLPAIESRLELRLHEDNSTGSAMYRYPFSLDLATGELKSHRFNNPAVFDAAVTQLALLNELRSDPTHNAEFFEIKCQEALAKALPSAVIHHTRLHTDKGVDVFGTIPFGNRLGNVFLFCQAKLQDIQGGAEIRTFYGACQYLLHARLRHDFGRAPENLKDFLLQMPMAPAVILVFCAASYSPEARDECVTLGVQDLDFPWIAGQLAQSTEPQ